MLYRAPQVFLALTNYDEEDLWDESDVADVARWTRERLVNFEFSEHVSKIDELRLGFINDDRALTNCGAFTVGQKLTVTWGWPGKLASPRQMIVAKREQANPYVVYLRDPTVLLGQKKRTRQMKNVTDSEFVRAVLKEYGYENSAARVAKTTLRREITQPGNRTDMTQLYVLAKRNGFEFYIDAYGAYWGPRWLSEEPVRAFSFRSGSEDATILGEPTVTHITDRAYSIVNVYGRDPVRKRGYQIQISSKDVDWESLGAEIELADPKQVEGSKRQSRAERHEARCVGYMTEDQARALARSIYLENAQGVYELKMSIIGDPDITAKRLIALTDHSIPYDGLYYVREAKHVIAPGEYRIELTCDRDALANVNAGKKIKRPAPKVLRLPDSDITGVESEDGDPLTPMLFIKYDANGENIVATQYHPNGDPNTTVTYDLSDRELAALPDSAARQLAEEGAFAPLPQN